MNSYVLRNPVNGKRNSGEIRTRPATLTAGPPNLDSKCRFHGGNEQVLGLT